MVRHSQLLSFCASFLVPPFIFWPILWYVVFFGLRVLETFEPLWFKKCYLFIPLSPRIPILAISLIKTTIASFPYSRMTDVCLSSLRPPTRGPRLQCPTRFFLDYICGLCIRGSLSCTAFFLRGIGLESFSFSLKRGSPSETYCSLSFDWLYTYFSPLRHHCNRSSRFFRQLGVTFLSRRYLFCLNIFWNFFS